jgi:methyltransferase family protein
LNNTSHNGQSEVSVASNVSYFLEHLSEYHDAVRDIDTYKTLHQFISNEVAGVSELLDIGNGGVFDYETSRVGSITAIDLFLGELPPDVVAKYFPQNCRLIQGSALALPERDGKFDMVLMVMLIHHLTSTDWRSSWNNARLALDEAWRSTFNRRILRALVVFSFRKARTLAFIAFHQIGIFASGHASISGQHDQSRAGEKDRQGEDDGDSKRKIPSTIRL